MNTKLLSTTLVAILLATCHQDAYGMRKMQEPPKKDVKTLDMSDLGQAIERNKARRPAQAARIHEQLERMHRATPAPVVASPAPHQEQASASDRKYAPWSGYQAPESAKRFEEWKLEKWSLTPINKSALGYTPDVMVIGCYDGYGSDKVVFAANTPKDEQGCVFQLSVQPLAETKSIKSDRTTNGGIKKGEFEPLSFKAQYAYAKYTPEQGWWDHDPAHRYTLKGSATVSSRIYGSDGSFIAHDPVTTNQLSIHSSGSLSTLSSDVLHIKVPSKDGKTVHFTGLDEISRAVYYEVSYGNDWNMRYNGVEGKCLHIGKVPQEAPRRGLVLILNDEDLKCFERTMEITKGNITRALRRLPLIMMHQELKDLFGFK